MASSYLEEREVNNSDEERRKRNIETHLPEDSEAVAASSITCIVCLLVNTL
jgi:hypothetical protein